MGFDQSKSTSTATGLFNNLTFLPSVAEEMKSNPEGVVAKLQELRKTCKWSCQAIRRRKSLKLYVSFMKCSILEASGSVL